MITLSNGCYFSEISVNPKNWNTKNADLSKSWYLFYRFYDPAFAKIPKYKKGKLIIIKAGINRLNLLSERKAAVHALIDAEMKLLQETGYNPITKRR